MLWHPETMDARACIDSPQFVVLTKNYRYKKRRDVLVYKTRERTSWVVEITVESIDLVEVAATRLLFDGGRTAGHCATTGRPRGQHRGDSITCE
ncbi:hypothetical protein EVAR_52026_1 [Eumeta japonica]|uniref:Uncharacterized protein n=1 Tax=Eumeta variegata TaxID=151549 RepID=A0A4C1YTT8_EUMVA|nr:hypothetical protein EVAR_52026_1 [Eumeta japonica]